MNGYVSHLNPHDMNHSEYEQRRNALLAQWQEARPEYSGPGRRFTLDGIMNYREWMQAKPRILFLMKENRAPDGDWEPIEGINTYSNSFSTNIARWRQIIREVYVHSTRDLSHGNIELPDSFQDIALIEIKKMNEGAGSSSKPDIRKYAERDKDFLKQQFDLIDPQVVVCGYTIEEYGDIIYKEEPWDKIIGLKNCHCYKHRNRLVIDMYHPSTRSHARARELSEILTSMLKDGNVFMHFDW